MVERTIQEALGRREFGQPEAQQVLDYFEQREKACIYCGKQPADRWDHLQPVNRGGETVLGNMVPACGPCDDSKQAYDYREWLPRRLSKLGQENPEIASGKLKQIEAYVTHFGYEATIVEKRLTESELLRLTELRHRALKLRADMEELFSDYASRGNQRE